ncbi:MAG: cupin domain-containing protein [Pseudomonadota bacterium]
MQIYPAGARATRHGPENYFTGHVLLEPIIAAPDPAAMMANIVSFAPGARTHWHKHDMGQALYVSQGAGLVCLRGEAPRPIRAGDTVWIPADVEHWHGAAPDTAMTHHAMQPSADGQETHWLEAVSPQDYVTP